VTRRKASPQQPSKKPSKGVKARQAAQAKRNRQVAIISIAVVVAAVVAIIVFSGKGTPAPSASGSGDAAAVADLVTGVPVSILDQIGAGQNVTPPMMLPPSTPALMENGKPDVFYYGAEYCPYCAAQRWPLALALSRFGTFSGLGLTTSSSTDTAPNTPSLSFHGSTYTSTYLSFSPVETQTRTGGALDTPTAAQRALVNSYDAPPYASGAGGIPFLMIGNQFVQVGASIDPTTLAGMTQLEVATALSDPAVTTTQEIAGSANMFTAALCRLTNGAPTNVCTAPGVKAVQSLLPTSPPAGS